MLRALIIFLVFVAAASAASAVSANTTTTRFLYVSGQPFSSGEGHGSSYDWSCQSWVENDLIKGAGVWAKGTTTFIDSRTYGWHSTITSYAPDVVAIMPVDPYFTKRAYCLNSSVQTYWANCYVWQYSFGGCV